MLKRIRMAVLILLVLSVNRGAFAEEQSVSQFVRGKEVRRGIASEKELFSFVPSVVQFLFLEDELLVRFDRNMEESIFEIELGYLDSHMGVGIAYADRVERDTVRFSHTGKIKESDRILLTLMNNNLGSENDNVLFKDEAEQRIKSITQTILTTDYGRTFRTFLTVHFEKDDRIRYLQYADGNIDALDVWKDQNLIHISDGLIDSVEVYDDEGKRTETLDYDLHLFEHYLKEIKSLKWENGEYLYHT